jgi:long-subunit acyl-CoA synthetase (AMP-forming)
VSGEILVRTGTPFLYGRTAGAGIEPAVWEDDAWWPTGDVGSLDADGFLTIHGRLRDFLALGTGEKVFVRPIEDGAVQATSASVCVLSQLGGTQLGALLFFGPAEVKPVEHCRARLAELNSSLHPWERIRSFAIVEGLPSIEEGSVTETMKLRRHKIEEIHARTATWHRVSEGERS